MENFGNHTQKRNLVIIGIEGEGSISVAQTRFSTRSKKKTSLNQGTIYLYRCKST